MKSTCQPVAQSRLGVGQVNTTHANLGKSELKGPVPYQRNELSAVESHLPIVKTLVFRVEEDTGLFAKSLAAQPALRDAYIELQGDLGAGKTTLVRHILRSLGVAGRIKSPTYAVVEPYEIPGLSIWHFDFYRFSEPREWEDAGFRDIFASPGLKLAEWPEKAKGLLPTADLAIALLVQPDESRLVTLTANTAIGQALITSLDQGEIA